jgi:molecular chaperone DnaK
MVQDAEANAEEDRQRREKIEVLNNAESIIHDTEKNLTEFKGDIEADAETSVRQQIQELRDMMADSEAVPEAIREKAGEVQQASLKAFEVAYKNRAVSGDSGDSSKDADFEDVNNKKD